MAFQEAPGALPFSGEFGPDAEFGLALMATRDRLHEAAMAEASGFAFVIKGTHPETGDDLATYLLVEDYDRMVAGEHVERFSISVPITGLTAEEPSPVPFLLPQHEFFVVNLTPGDITTRLVINRENYGRFFERRRPVIRDFRQKLHSEQDGGYELAPIRKPL